jgi:tetratricopeptide (TPR) repeat protein
MQTGKIFGLSLCAGLLLFTAGCERLQSRDQMNKGVQSYKNNHYADAVKHFKEAVRLDPSNSNAQSYLAVSYMIQWVPGADSPENKRNYDAAKQEFNEILKREPSNSLALASMASMAYNSASSGTEEQRLAALGDAKKWNERRIEADPNQAEPYYYLGVIDWAQSFPPIRDARAAAKMKPEDPGPIKDPKVKAELKSKLWDQINHGIQNLEKCLNIDKENEDAMSYMNLLYREKAVLEESVDEAKADIAKAEDWSNKSLDMKKIKAARPAKKTQAS